MRGDQAARGLPQPVAGRQGLGVGDIQGRAQPPGLQLGQQGGGVHHGAAADVHQQRPVTHPGQESLVDQPLGVIGVRQRHDHHFGLRQQRIQLIDAVDNRAIGQGARRAGHRQQLCWFEGQQPSLDFLAHPAVAQQQHPGPVQAAAPSGFPALFTLAVHGGVHPTQRGQDQGQAVLGGRVLDGPARVAQPHPGGQVLQHPLVADRHQVHMLQSRNARDPGTVLRVAGPLGHQHLRGRGIRGSVVQMPHDRLDPGQIQAAGQLVGGNKNTQHQGSSRRRSQGPGLDPTPDHSWHKPCRRANPRRQCDRQGLPEGWARSAATGPGARARGPLPRSLPRFRSAAR